MKKLYMWGLALFLLCAVATKSQAVWIWMNGTPGTDFNDRATQLYSTYHGWYYIQPASSVNVVNMNNNGWWKLEHSALRMGWSWWAMPWLYSSYNNTWYWMAPEANWLYHYNSSGWVQLKH
jgi:hypothetical protein